MARSGRYSVALAGGGGFRDAAALARGLGDALQRRPPVPASSPVPVLLLLPVLVGGALVSAVAAPELLVLLPDGLAPLHLLVLPRPQRLGHLLRGDEAVDLAEEQRVLGLEQLDPCDLGPSPAAGGGGRRGGGVPGGGGGLIGGDTEDDERDVVARVGPHDLGGGGGPVEALHLPAGVLDDDRRRLRRLAVAHRARPRAPALVVLDWWFQGAAAVAARVAEREAAAAAVVVEETVVMRLPFLRWGC